MNKFSKVIVGLGIAAGLASPAPAAFAQRFDREWTPVTTTQGCVFYEQQYLAEMNASDQWAYTWSGDCSPGTAISGTGTLSGVHPSGDRNDITGRFVKGYKDGVFRFVRSNPQTRNEMTVRYTMGCGSFNRPDQCRPARR